jgi:hypothetical protein
MAKRTVIGRGGAHKNPIPAAVRIGHMIFPSVISGHNPNGPTSEEPIEQIRQAFIWRTFSGPRGQRRGRSPKSSFICAIFRTENMSMMSGSRCSRTKMIAPPGTS